MSQPRFGFWTGFMRGLTAPLDVYVPFQAREPRTAAENLRADWARIGADFKVVIARVNGRRTG